MDILTLISDKDRLDFSQNLSVTRNYLGDTLFPDIKTENLEAEYFRLSDGMTLPSMALVHAFDTEAAIGTRPALEKVTVEKLLIKEKINQSERIQLYLSKGVSENSVIDYVFDDMGRLAESVKTRTEVAKMEALSAGAVTVKENNLDLKIDCGVPNSNRKRYSWSNPEADILGDIQEMIDIAKAQGKTVNRGFTSTKIVGVLRKNKGIQTAMYGANGVGTFISLGQLNTLMTDMFGFTIVVNDDMYKIEKPGGGFETKRYFTENKFVLATVDSTGALGTGLWGVTPEELDQGPWTAKSQDQYITITQWKTPDPATVWTKASGLFVPVLPDPYGLVIGTIATA